MTFISQNQVTVPILNFRWCGLMPKVSFFFVHFVSNVKRTRFEMMNLPVQHNAALIVPEDGRNRTKTVPNRNHEHNHSDNNNTNKTME